MSLGTGGTSATRGDSAPSLDHVLVLEDHDFQRRAAVHMLRECGVGQVLEARDGAEALEKSRSQSIDVLVCDLAMPGMDGIAFLRYVAQEHLAANVIIASSLDAGLLGSVELMAKSYGLNVLGVLEKPLTTKRLGDLLQRAAPKSGAERCAEAARHTADDLREALASGDIIPYFQPKVALSTDEILGVEILARWRHPKLGILPPSTFLPIAESAGLFPALTDSVLEQSFAAWKRWSERGVEVKLALNLESHALEDLTLPDHLAERADAYGIPHDRLIVEITETAVAGETPESLGNLVRLRLKGFGLSIDDYGTGYSSMQQLSRAPFTELKIDRSFVDGASTNPKLRAILESSLELAKKLGLDSVAEGVERPDDFALLRKLGCKVIQGFLVARPMPAEDFMAWYRARGRSAS